MDLGRHTIVNNYTATDAGVFVFRCAWGAGDSGYEEVTITTSDMALHSALVYNQPRETLAASDSDLVVEEYDNGRVGLQESQLITISDTAGMNALIERMQSAKNHLHPCAWVEVYKDDDSDAPSVANGAGWQNPFGDLTFKHKAPSLYGDTVAYRAYYRTWGDSGVSYQVRFTGGAGGTVTSSTRSNTSPGTYFLLPTIDATTDDEITFEMQVTAGTGNVYVSLCQGIKGG